MTQVFQTMAAARSALGHCAVTIGKYDGMHIGHQHILDTLKTEASRLGVPSLVILSEPQPEEFFAGAAAPPRLNHFQDKVNYLRSQQIDAIYRLPFNSEISQQSPEEFVECCLLKGLSMKSLVIGEDFRFGRNRTGDVALLRKLGSSHGFNVITVTHRTESEERVSSTLIRQYLQQGDCERVRKMLGRPYSISGKVIRGRQLGRQLGYPTANIELLCNKAPMTGIFVVQVLHDGKVHQGVASLGFNPTVNEGKSVALEVYLLDFDADLYGEIVEVSFLHKLRDERKFDNLDLLKQQIAADVAAARRYFQHE